MTLSTHVLDATTGRPAVGMPVRLDARDDDRWAVRFQGSTDADGRLRLDGDHEPGTYRFTFLTGDYFHAIGITAFYPEVTITFTVASAAEHCHAPLLLSPFAYTTYRGS